MNIAEQIEEYISGQPEPKRGEMRALDRLVRDISPECRLWFLDGRDAKGKIVSNPNVGYGIQTIPYANSKSREFYRIGISANTTGISVYVMGLEDKKYLSETWGDKIGKAEVTGYCIKFKTLGDIDTGTLEEIIRFAM